MIVERERKTNMYFNAIGFINDVKRGPFWEHSPILFDISGVKAGWAKINKVSHLRRDYQAIPSHTTYRAC
jgi:serine/threonine-protein phosphatase 2A activator